MNRAAALFFPIFLLALRPAWADAAEYPQACRQAVALEKKAYRQVASFQRTWKTDTFNQWNKTFYHAWDRYATCGRHTGDQRTIQFAAMGIIRSMTWVGFWLENATLGDAEEKPQVSGFQGDRENALWVYHVARRLLSTAGTHGWAFTKRADWRQFSARYAAWLAKATDRLVTLTDEKASFTKVSAENDQAWNLLPDSPAYPHDLIGDIASH